MPDTPSTEPTPDEALQRLFNTAWTARVETRARVQEAHDVLAAELKRADRINKQS